MITRPSSSSRTPLIWSPGRPRRRRWRSPNETCGTSYTATAPTHAGHRGITAASPGRVARRHDTAFVAFVTGSLIFRVYAAERLDLMDDLIRHPAPALVTQPIPDPPASSGHEHRERHEQISGHRSSRLLKERITERHRDSGNLQAGALDLVFLSAR